MVVVRIMCLFLLSSIFILNSTNHGYAGTPGDDLLALAALKRAIIIDRNKCLKSWDITLVHPCTWYSITCDENNRVTDVNLGGCNMDGTLVPELGNLDKLENMNLYRNALMGGIPPELGNLTNLGILDLSNNILNGSIPRELGKLTNLTRLTLYTNALMGGIPPELGNLVNLTTLSLQDNFLDGPIPNELSNLKNLQSLELQFNNLNGSVPNDLENNFKTMMLVNLTDNKGPGGRGGLSGSCTEKACCDYGLYGYVAK